MDKTAQSGAATITPDDFQKIEAVFRELLRERNLALESEEADALAARLITLFQSGIHDRGALKQMAAYI